jgi:hypothetical protein
MASLKAKLFTAASADTGLQALLGTSPFRWSDQQKQQPFPAPSIAVCIVSNPRAYVMGGQLSTSWTRVQFTVYGTGNDSENADAVVNALATFLRGFNGYSTRDLPAFDNRIVNDRDGGIADTDPLTYQRFVDVMIFNDETI